VRSGQNNDGPDEHVAAKRYRNRGAGTRLHGAARGCVCNGQKSGTDDHTFGSDRQV
jgi:hypothetical protein